MAGEDQVLATNQYGEVSSWKNVHPVDASIFPTIPAQSITATIMANAYRIGKERPIGPANAQSYSRHDVERV